MDQAEEWHQARKPKDLKGTMVKLIKYMRRFYVPIVMVIIFAIASTVFNIVGPTILGDATTEIFKGLVRKVSGGSGIDFDKVKHILLMLLSLICSKCDFLIYSGTDHDTCIKQCQLPDEKRYFREDSSYANEIF